jgi:hypothetical protein
LIPFISKNNRIDEPYMILSQQLLVTLRSNPMVISHYINMKIEQSLTLYNIDELERFNIVFKYKEVKFQFDRYNKFI